MSIPEFNDINYEYPFGDGNFSDPINSICYKKCAKPNEVVGSSRLPTPTDIEQALLAKVESWTNRTLSLFLSTIALNYLGSLGDF